MCEAFVEGSEIGDCVETLCSAIRCMSGISLDHEAQLVLLAAENVCRNFIEYLRTEGDSYEEYEEFPEEVFKHFTDGARKLTQEEFEN